MMIEKSKTGIDAIPNLHTKGKSPPTLCIACKAYVLQIAVESHRGETRIRNECPLMQMQTCQ